MATERWTGGSGVGFTWTTCISSGDLSTLPSSNTVLSSVGDITNQTALDIFADVSINFQSITPTGTPYFSIYLYPLNQDGSTYGDGQLTAGAQTSVVPSANYFKGSIAVSTQAIAPVGIVTGIVIPPGTFRFAIQNNANVALGSTNTVKYRTYNRVIA